MHYFIDGYNLMFRVLRAGDDLQKQRLSIIRDLNHKIQFLALDVTIVFDAQYHSGESSRSQRKHIDIRFTEQGETADEFILHQLKHVKNPRQYTVITSDKKLAWLVRRRGAHTESVEEFLKWLNNRYKNKLKRSTTPPTLQNIVSKQKEVAAPSQPSSLEESYEYYLKQFEMNFQEWSQTQQPVKKVQKVSKKKKMVKDTLPKDEGLSNLERWQKAFERKLEEDSI